MKTTVTIVCPENLSAGFELAGVEAFGFASIEAAGEELLKRASSGKWGVVLVTDEIMNALPARDRKILDESSMPLFVGLPVSLSKTDETDRERACRLVSDMIQKAVGKKIAVGV